MGASVGAAALSAGDMPASWASPSGSTLRSLGTLPADGEARLAFEDNLECAKASYRLNGTAITQKGCFASTAFGSLDVENELLNFDGDEKTAVPLLPYGPHEVLLAWPGTSSMLAINPSASEGAYLSLYRDALGASEDQHNIIGQVVAKKMTRPADVPLLDPAGRKLIVNFNSIAFSNNGSWLVVESMSGLFYRIGLSSLEARPFAPSFANFGAGYTQSQVAVSSSGDYVAIANSGAHSLRVYDLTTCSGPYTENTICPSYDYWPFVGTKAADWQHPVHLRFLNEDILSFTNTVSSGQTTYQLAPFNTGFALMDYLALGDSYASGEGAFSYKSETDTESNNCHASSRAYPLLLSKKLYSKFSGNTVACSGARISDIFSNPDYRGQVQDGNALNVRPKVEVQKYLTDFAAGYLPQSTFISHYQPGVITVSIGGNDIGFGNILKLCVAPHINPHVTNANACFNTYEDRLELAELIDSQVGRYTKLFQYLHRNSPGSRIYTIGYPLIAVDTGSCAVNVHLNTGELALSIDVTKHLNLAMATAAKAAGVDYVDIENALAGHRLCEVRSDLVAVNGVTAGNDGGLAVSLAGHPFTVDFLGRESFHPNAYGQELMEQAIYERTGRFQQATPSPVTAPPATAPTDAILKAPKSGRPTVRRLPVDLSPHQSVKKGTSIPIKINGNAHGLKPKSRYVVKMHQPGNVTQIGVIVSDGAGDLNAELPIDGNSELGSHEISVDGADQLGNPVSMIDVITVFESDQDYDGDGLSNTVDSCPTIFNSGQDADGDLLDDACDSYIGPPPANPVVQAHANDTGSATSYLPGSQSIPAANQSLATNTPNYTYKKSLLSVQPPLPAGPVTKLQTASEVSVLSDSTSVRSVPLKPTTIIIAGQRSVTHRQIIPLRRVPWLWFMLVYASAYTILKLSKKPSQK